MCTFLYPGGVTDRVCTQTYLWRTRKRWHVIKIRGLFITEYTLGRNEEFLHVKTGALRGILSQPYTEYINMLLLVNF
jgi:hypothetical protein